MSPTAYFCALSVLIERGMAYGKILQMQGDSEEQTPAALSQLQAVRLCGILCTDLLLPQNGFVLVSRSGSW